MFRIIIFSGALLIAGSAFAQDPGARDSVIIETVYAELGDSTVDVRIYATSDDSVFFYNLPITWYSPDSAINISHVTYHSMLTSWDDCYDTLLYNQRLLRMVGWCDIAGPENPPLITNNNREHCWTISFSIDSLASAQTVFVDSIFDPVHGSLLFALGDGITYFTPVFTPGAIYYGITTDVDEYNQNLPDDFTLLHNYPNPFNASTTIEFTLPEQTEVELSVYNILGQKVAVIFGEIKQAGVHRVTWDVGEFPSGLYFARLETGDISKSVKMVLLE